LRPEIPAHIDPAAELSPTRLAASIAWLSDTALREAIAAGRVRSRPVRPTAGGRKPFQNRVLIPREFVKDAKRLPECTAPGCSLPALADNGTCGQRGHSKAGRPRPPGVYYDVTKTPAAKAGRFSLVRAARELGVDRTMLRRRIDSGDIDADLDANGYFALDPAEVERVRRDFQCRTPGCNGVAIGDSGYCGSRSRAKASACPNAGAASRAGKPRPAEERKRIAASRRRQEDEVNEQLQRMGLVDSRAVAAAIVYSPHTIRGAALRERAGRPAGGRPPTKHVEVVTGAGIVVRRVVSDALALGRWYADRFGTWDARNRLAPARSKARGTTMGRTPALSESELAMILKLRIADPDRWSYRQLAAEVNQERAPHAERVSHMAVKRSLDTAMTRSPAV